MPNRVAGYESRKSKQAKKKFKRRKQTKMQLIMGLKGNPFFFSCPITSPVASISRAVHTALSILHHILWWRKASSQTYKRKW
jgi:hypothetical protein